MLVSSALFCYTFIVHNEYVALHRMEACMNINPIELTEELMGVLGVNVQLITEPFTNMEEFDNSLRFNLYQDYDYSAIITLLNNECRDNTVYITSDQFETQYYILKIPVQKNEPRSYLSIGPYLIKEYTILLREIMQRNDLPLIQLSELKQYYMGIPYFPITHILNSYVFILAKHIFGTEQYIIDKHTLFFSPAKNEPNIRSDKRDALSLKVIEEVYSNEEALLSAVADGNFKKASILLSGFSKFQREPRIDDTLRDSKNYMIAFNALLRKTVQHAAVHPAHIDDTSSGFVKRFESAKDHEELKPYMDEMIRKYCLLVQNHSLRRFSGPVRRALNYIDFNYAEAVTLDGLSQVAEVSPSYLSTQFKKEVGVSVVDYVNQKRTQRAQFLLSTTTLPIHQIAEAVGYLDDTYFARTFKRNTGKSPRDYRKLFK